MKKYFTWTTNLCLILISASALTYTIHYLIFHDSHHIFIYMLGDIGFLFLDVLLVVIIIERILTHREKKTKINKLNMVIGTFFSEVGLELLKKFSSFVHNAEKLEKKVNISPQWTKKDFKTAITAAREFSYEIKIEGNELLELRDFLIDKRSFLLRLLENPNLLEHESFTDLLWAVFHLTEELVFRGDKLKLLAKEDLKHIDIDIKRAFSQITSIWIAYTEHLKKSYPFLFSLASRINPMNPNASPFISS